MKYLEIFIYAALIYLLIKTLSSFNKGRKATESAFGLSLTNAEAALSKSKVFAGGYMETAKDFIRKSKGKLIGDFAKVDKVNNAVKEIDGTFDYVLNRTQIGEKMIGIVKSFKNKLQLCQLSEAYQKKTGHDMITNIANHTHDNAIQIILNYSETLPTGIIKR